MPLYAFCATANGKIFFGTVKEADEKSARDEITIWLGENAPADKITFLPVGEDKWFHGEEHR